MSSLRPPASNQLALSSQVSQDTLPFVLHSEDTRLNKIGPGLSCRSDPASARGQRSSKPFRRSSQRPPCPADHLTQLSNSHVSHGL